jgi:CheY-like chemotaxis protein
MALLAASKAGPDDLRMTTVNPRILVVDDEPSVSLLCEYILRDAGYEVDAVTTAARAIELMRTQRYGVMVIDLVMPEGGGLRTIQAARAMRPSTPVIVMTAEPRHLVPPRTGMAFYLHKPFSSLSALEELVARALSSGAPGAASGGDSVPGAISP